MINIRIYRPIEAWINIFATHFGFFPLKDFLRIVFVFSWLYYPLDIYIFSAIWYPISSSFCEIINILHLKKYFNVYYYYFIILGTSIPIFRSTLCRRHGTLALHRPRWDIKGHRPKNRKSFRNWASGTSVAWKRYDDGWEYALFQISHLTIPYSQKYDKW